eukprot:jgi/Botrbrau1/21641/Bobra.43_1s0043.1
MCMYTCNPGTPFNSTSSKTHIHGADGPDKSRVLDNGVHQASTKNVVDREVISSDKASLFWQAQGILRGNGGIMYACKHTCYNPGACHLEQRVKPILSAFHLILLEKLLPPLTSCPPPTSSTSVFRFNNREAVLLYRHSNGGPSQGVVLPSFLIPKRNCGWRLCINYGAPNI